MLDIHPFIRTPLTDIGGCMTNHQGFKRCRDFEMRFVECMEAYGVPKGYRKCSDLFEDFHECTTRSKQRQRMVMMARERDRQFKAGILKEKFSPSPKEDSY